jgi:predicted transcriptional regulator
MKISTTIIEKVKQREFNYQDFLDVIFGKSKKRRIAGDIILKEVYKEPTSISDIVSKHNLGWGTTYEAFRILQRHGLVDRDARFAPVRPSKRFKLILQRLVHWFEKDFEKEIRKNG